MISFAGFDLTLDSKYQHLQRYWESVGHDAIPKADVLDRIGNRAHPSPVGLNSPQLPEIGVNQLYWPTDHERPAIGHFLISKDVYDALVMGSLNSGRLRINTTGDPADDWTSLMYVVSMVPLHVVEDEFPLYLLTLGDLRWLRYLQSIPTEDPAYPEGAQFSFAGLPPSLLLERCLANLGTPSPVYGSELVTTLSGKWAGFSYGTPGNLIAGAYHGSTGRRYVPHFGTEAESIDVWSQAKDDALWTAIEGRVVAGGRLTSDQVKRLLPSSVDVRSSDGHTETYTLTTLLGESSTGNGRTASLQVDPHEYNASHSLAVASNWLKNHRGTFDGTINGIIPLTLHGGIDYLLATHRVEQCNTRIVRWGKFFQPNFSYGPLSSPVYGLGAVDSLETHPAHMDLKDGVRLNFAFASGSGAKYPANTTGFPRLLPGDDWQMALPEAGLYEIDFRVNVLAPTTREVENAYTNKYIPGDVKVSLQTFSGTTWDTTVISEYQVAATPQQDVTGSFVVGEVFLITIPVRLPHNGGFSLRWLQLLPEDPVLKVEFLTSYPYGPGITGWMSLTVNRAGYRANS